MVEKMEFFARPWCRTSCTNWNVGGAENATACCKRNDGVSRAGHAVAIIATGFRSETIVVKEWLLYDIALMCSGVLLLLLLDARWSTHITIPW